MIVSVSTVSVLVPAVVAEEGEPLGVDLHGQASVFLFAPEV
jgi:hypothetical protein